MTKVLWRLKAMDEHANDAANAPQRFCQKCGENPVGPGGIVCPACKTAIEARIYPSRNPVLAAELDGR